ncbi:MAG: YggT family protein [Thermobacillus sp.]|uniref:Putative integral membrane protein n=1 Tax=Thermobacillus composti (strain DSM 18247 / JCM 13945 / KWC4) TaxID=717605 RepID=L0EFL4_THECK|nr:MULTISPECIES: YggT family protein [Thermobacillus]AGA58414.1 putative integral membrane protein [Thermobacillus composti KWC4]REK54796.1 MAG: YggT family protein [Thermobacillus sp.]
MSEIESLIWLIHRIYTFVIIAYVLLSWIPNARDSFIGEMLGKLVEPYLAPFRRLIPPIGGMLDISPIVAIFALQFIAMGLIAVIEFFI